jgi:hypothetical protein
MRSRRSRGLSFRASSSRSVLTPKVYARRLPGRLTGCASAASRANGVSDPREARGGEPAASAG